VVVVVVDDDFDDDDDDDDDGRGGRGVIISTSSFGVPPISRHISYFRYITDIFYNQNINNSTVEWLVSLLECDTKGATCPRIHVNSIRDVNVLQLAQG